MVTTLEALTRSNVVVDVRAVAGGSNTGDDDKVEVTNWVDWQEFNYHTLTEIFRRELSQEYHGDRTPNPLPNDLCIFHEDTFDDVLRRFVVPTVNYSLNRQYGECHFGRGSRCEGPDVPDWSVVSPFYVNNKFYVNILPGDTKVSAKWQPTMMYDDPTEWGKVLTQVVTYMKLHASRYGFIITDACLVPLRLTRREIGSGLALERSKRQVGAVSYTPGHQTQPSDASMSSAGFGSVYSDSNPVLWDYYDPEYAVIPWNAHGSHTLTVKLALWCLAMMSVKGGNDIRYAYPPLDSWQATDTGFVHNTSGATKSSLSRGDVLHGTTTGAAAYPSAWTGDEAGGSSAQQYVLETGEASGTSGAAAVSLPYVGSGHQHAEAGYAETEGHAVYEEGDDGGDEDANTIVGHPAKKVIRVHIRQRFRGGYCFKDETDNERKTTKEKWQPVHGGYELDTPECIYFTKKFP
ncbi:hypothetical protein SPI_03518 [Niveomyces insectorum RCEF 264]|uniref:Uncharacterized protein n=1 Tax=Niveomyces insectorum RCEF 264 TaxID=1081102 RepID=A0A167W586_9HYPO|nr:hypothetical protein SPI_03518 [Niveomyces insectorum RCEF 264]